jgi:hypothetical protein
MHDMYMLPLSLLGQDMRHGVETELAARVHGDGRGLVDDDEAEVGAVGDDVDGLVPAGERERER